MALSGAIASMFNTSTPADAPTATSADTSTSTPTDVSTGTCSSAQSSERHNNTTAQPDLIRYLPDPHAVKAPIQRLSNELLTIVIRNLDPPTAVCMALSCKQFYHVVPAACGVPLGGICPPFKSDSGVSDSKIKEPNLAPFSADELLLADVAASGAAITAVRRQMSLFDGRTLPKLMLTPAYSSLIDKLY
jgi:hypothetical protein